MQVEQAMPILYVTHRLQIQAAHALLLSSPAPPTLASVAVGLASAQSTSTPERMGMLHGHEWIIKVTFKVRGGKQRSFPLFRFPPLPPSLVTSTFH